MKKLILAILFLIPSVASANLHVGMPGLPRGIPDFCALDPNRYIIPAGTTVTLSSPVTYSTICVRGKLILNTQVKVITLFVDEGGTLEGSTFEVIGRDVPLLGPEIDPDQWGNGLIVFGAIHITGVPHALNINDKVRSAIFRSENPSGTRWHFMSHGRADVRIKYAAFLNMGRTTGLPLDSSTYDANGVLTHYGGQQIGKYSVHFHFTFGLPPGNGNTYQFEFEGNVCVGDSKWCYVAHSSSFGIFKSNICDGTVGSCGVEEFGDETGNQWIDNIFTNVQNPSWTVPIGADYDPEGRACSGFWLRGINQVLRGNHISNVCSGIGWWTGCAEDGPCAPFALIKIPKVPGADTSDPTMIETCKGGDGSPAPCKVFNRVGLAADDNWVSNAVMCAENWWTPRIQNGSLPITNLHCNNVTNGVLYRYSDIGYQNLTMVGTGTGTAVPQFNDAAGLGIGTAQSYIKNSSMQGFDIAYIRTGQLGQATSWLWDNVVADTTTGFQFSNGGEAQLGARIDNSGIEKPRVAFNNISFPVNKPLMVLETQPPTVPREFNITVTNTLNANYQVYFAQPTPCTTTRPEIVGGYTCPLGTPIPPPPLSITVSPNIIQVSPDGAPIIVQYPAPVVTGGTPPITTGCSPISGSLFSVGVTTVTCLTTDSAMMKAAGMFTVTVTFTPIPPNPCTTLPLRVQVTKWPTGDTGNKSGTWNSGNFTLVERDFLSPPMRFFAKDDRGCTITLVKP